MKHDAWLRDEARHHYELHNIEPESDFDRAERKREPEYLEAVEVAYAKRAAGWEWEARARQLPLL